MVFNELDDQPLDLEIYLSHSELISGQVLYWKVSSDKYIISMDVSDEKLSKTFLPNLSEEIDQESINFFNFFC